MMEITKTTATTFSANTDCTKDGKISQIPLSHFLKSNLQFPKSLQSVNHNRHHHIHQNGHQTVQGVGGGNVGASVLAL